MGKMIAIPGGILTLSVSKANCPHCQKHIPFEDIEDKYMKQDKTYIRMKCNGCKRFIGISTDMMGDYLAFDLKPDKNMLMHSK